jgi:hypothetical protein
MNTEKSRFDYINFAYGMGAAVILIAAMFKFLGWNYANEIFIVGLTTEAIVFVVSAFQWKIVSRGYKWENLFPQLIKDKVNEQDRIDLSEGINQYYKNTESITRSVETLEKSLQGLATVSENLVSSVKSISNQLNNLENSSVHYEEELNNLKERLSNVNQHYSNLLSIVDDKN